MSNNFNTEILFLKLHGCAQQLCFVAVSVRANPSSLRPDELHGYACELAKNDDHSGAG